MKSYAILTTEANADVAPYHDRQMAVLRRADRMQWLDHGAGEEDVLRPLPPSTFNVRSFGRKLQSELLL